MRLTPPEIHILDREGFTPKKDIFERATLGSGLTRLLSRVDEPLVVAFDDQWGSGKTTFLKMWASELRRQNYPVVYFDAFANDYVEDAFTALAAEVFELIDETGAGKGGFGAAFATRAIDAGKVILRSGLKIGVRAATAGALSTADIGDLVGDISGEAEKTFDEHVGSLITEKKERKATLDAFRAALGNLPNVLAPPGDGSADSSPKPLVFIIDELDRCRPTFALELLERTKHFFSVPGVHFVLGTHMTQLQHAVSAVYGSDVDSRTYLEKFVNVSILPASKAERHDSDVDRFMNYLQRAFEFHKDDRDASKHGLAFIGNYAKLRGLSLRTIERICTNFAVALAFRPEQILMPSPIVAGLCVIKSQEAELFRSIKRGPVSFERIRQVFSFAEDPDNPHRELQMGEDWWRFAADEKAPQELVDRFSSALWNYNVRDRLDLPRLIATGVVDAFETKQ